MTPIRLQEYSLTSIPQEAQITHIPTTLSESIKVTKLIFSLPNCKLELYDDKSTLLDVQRHFSSLTPLEQREYVRQLVAEKLDQ